MKVIDFHTHAFPDELAEKALHTLHEAAGDYRAYHNGTISGLLESMDRAGIEQAIVASIATNPDQVAKITRWSIKIQSERIIPFASIHPKFRRFSEELKKIREAGLKGIKLHPMFQDFTVDDPSLFPLYDAITENGLILLFHAGGDIAFPGNHQADPGRLLQVHKAFPELKMVASHLGGWQTWEEVAGTLLGRPVYLETSFARGEARPSTFLQILHHHSPDYFLFGTDSPWLDQKMELEAWKALPLPGDFKEKIFSKNAEKLLFGH